MEEYEYSFNVKSIKPYIEYVESKGYEKQKEVLQNRVVYENIKNRSIIARITTDMVDNEKKTVFDCKNTSVNENDLKVSNESLPLVIPESDIKSIESILDTLEFTKTSDLIRTRYVYVLDGVKFEIDNYSKPVMQVVALEGERSRVDIVYKEIKELIK